MMELMMKPTFKTHNNETQAPYQDDNWMNMETRYWKTKIRMSKTLQQETGIGKQQRLERREKNACTTLRRETSPEPSTG